MQVPRTAVAFPSATWERGGREEGKESGSGWRLTFQFRRAQDDKRQIMRFFPKKLFDILERLAHPQARTRPLLNLRRKFLNSGVDFLPLSQG